MEGIFNRFLGSEQPNTVTKYDKDEEKDEEKIKFANAFVEFVNGGNTNNDTYNFTLINVTIKYTNDNNIQLIPNSIWLKYNYNKSIDNPKRFIVKVDLPNKDNNNNILSVQIKGDVDTAIFFKNDNDLQAITAFFNKPDNKSCIPNTFFTNNTLNINSEAFENNDQTLALLPETYTNQSTPSNTYNNLARNTDNNPLKSIQLEFFPVGNVMYLTRKIYGTTTKPNDDAGDAYYRINMKDTNVIDYMINTDKVTKNEFNSLPKWIPQTLITDGKLNIAPLPSVSSLLGGSGLHTNQINANKHVPRKISNHSSNRNNNTTNKRQRRKRSNNYLKTTSTNRRGRKKARSSSL